MINNESISHDDDMACHTREKRGFSNQLIFDYMLSSTLFRLHNNIYLKKFHVDGMGWHLKWVDVSTSVVSVWHWPLIGVDHQNIF